MTSITCAGDSAQAAQMAALSERVLELRLAVSSARAPASPLALLTSSATLIFG
jgi:hypothetical protein